MKSVEQGLRDRASARLPILLFLGILACLGVGALLILRAPIHREVVHARAEAADTDQSLEIDRLKQAVGALEQRSTALAIAVSSAQRDANVRPKDSETPTPPPQAQSPRTAADEITDLEVRFTSERDGSRDGQLAARTMHAELSSAPLHGARITEVRCSTSLCRATLEQDVNAPALDMAALIDAAPSVKRESMFSYGQEGSVKRVTIYSAREGHHLDPGQDDDGAGTPAP